MTIIALLAMVAFSGCERQETQKQPGGEQSAPTTSPTGT